MDKVREARLRCVHRREDDDCAKLILEADVYGQWSRGRQRKRWIDIIKYDLESGEVVTHDGGRRSC